ncbi:MAG: N-acetylmuramoyl-L-alanine amidase CwlD [Clostridiales bacterium]|nr:N-acetylmuramoyl-L-alanine amidase CwlD [Clostridiales bacterium]
MWIRKYFSLIFLCLVYIACLLTSGDSVKVMKRILSRQTSDKQITIVIDPGHGGRDPGKIGINNALEKDINLSIALKLRDLLEENGIKVIMTREEDVGLYDENDSNKKRADLKKRVEIINSSGALFAISIHQNSFTQESSRGAQVFYHNESKEGKRLAEMIQTQLKETIADGNHRQAKANNTYYMLSKTTCPLVIVECGFLSNRREAELLLDGEYQAKMAWGIHLAIINYINNINKPEA